jgi:hypothetical protein
MLPIRSLTMPARTAQIVWAAASTAVGVLAVAEMQGFASGALERWRWQEAGMLGFVMLVLLLVGARTSLRGAVAAALAAGAGAALGGEVVTRWGWDFTRVDGLVPNLCAHQLQHGTWILLVACAAALAALAAGAIARNPVVAVAAGAFGAPLIVWWTHTSVAYGCG